MVLSGYCSGKLGEMKVAESSVEVKLQALRVVGWAVVRLVVGWAVVRLVVGWAVVRLVVGWAVVKLVIGWVVVRLVVGWSVVELVVGSGSGPVWQPATGRKTISADHPFFQVVTEL